MYVKFTTHNVGLNLIIKTLNFSAVVFIIFHHKTFPKKQHLHVDEKWNTGRIPLVERNKCLHILQASLFPVGENIDSTTLLMLIIKDNNS